MNRFCMNGRCWTIKFVDPHCPLLVDRTHNLRVATTDPETSSIYVSNAIFGNFKTRVIIHELGHCALLSFDMLADIHRMTYPEYWIEMEEWICNFIADYGEMIFSKVYRILGADSLNYIPQAIENWIRA